MTIPFFTLSRQNKGLVKEAFLAIREVINKGVFVLGEKGLQFEEEFARYIGVKYAVGVASGTDAISLALMALGVGSDDEVIIPANAYPTAFAVTAIGAVPKPVDIDPATYNIDPRQIPAAITDKTKAVIAVHMYGLPADMDEINRIGKEYKIPIIEDCAQAVGSSIKYYVSSIKYQKEKSKIHNTKYIIHNTEMYQSQNKLPRVERKNEIWKKTGSIGDMGCFSFYPTKNLACFGDGGMTVTNNKELAERVRKLRMYGEESRYHSVILGRNSRLDELQAAILLVKLKHLDRWNERRREIAEEYLSHLGKLSNLGYLSEKIKHVYHLFVIRAKRRDELKSYLEKNGIGTGIHYPVPVHLVQSFKFLGYKKGDFPQSEKACREILSLPMWPELKDEEVGKVAAAVGEFENRI